MPSSTACARERSGSYLHVAGAEPLAKLQKVAVEESRLGIPLLFAMDVVHGYRTIFPVPIALAATWAPESQERAARVAADEATSAGLHWTFAPMIDIARDPRWGRIVEGAGEDPYLGARMAVAQVNGYQGGNLLRPGSLMATAKHFGAYGAAIGGRDYNSADISERTLQEVYLPPFYAAARAGAGSFMAAFNDIAGVPTTVQPRSAARRCCASAGAGRASWSATGARSASSSITASRRIARPRRTLALDASVDMDMVGGVYADDLKDAVSKDPARLKQLDEAVLRILRVKEQLGLFDKPMQYHDVEREARELLSPEHREAARAIARQSMVLLKNEGKLLPLDPAKLRSVAVIGALATDGLSALGSWRAQGKAEEAVTMLQGITAALPKSVKVSFAAGADPRTTDLSGIAAAVKIAKTADVTVLVIGEDFDLSGEARSRSDLELPASQLELAKRVLATGKPVVVVLANGRPLALPWLAENAPAILETWMLGVEGGNALADVLFGKYSPAGRLPGRISACHRRRAVQLLRQRHRAAPPIRISRKTRCVTTTCPSRRSSRLDTDSRTANSATAISRKARRPWRRANASTSRSPWRTSGGVASDEVVQLYVRDPVASIARPVLELRGFKRIELAAGARKRVTFSLTPEQFAFLGPRGQWLIEAGRIDFWVGASSADLRSNGSFEITKTHTGTAPAAALPTRVTVSSN